MLQIVLGVLLGLVAGGAIAYYVATNKNNARMRPMRNKGGITNPRATIRMMAMSR